MLERDFVLEGQRVRLEPVADRHRDGIRHAGNDPAIWEFTYQRNPFTTHDDATAWFRAALPGASHLAFAVIDKHSGDVVGSTRFLDIEPQHRKLEIGYTFLARDLWRTGINVECKYLLLRHAFEAWNATRVQLKANALNARSRTAMERLGATFEGVLRNFRIQPVTGELSSVAMYSIIDEEWPRVRSRLESRLYANSAGQTRDRV